MGGSYQALCGMKRESGDAELMEDVYALAMPERSTGILIPVHPVRELGHRQINPAADLLCIVAGDEVSGLNLP